MRDSKTKTVQDENKNVGVFFPSSGSSPSAISLDGDAPLAQPPPDGQIQAPQASAGQTVIADEPKKQNVLVRLAKRADVILAVLLILGSIGLVISASGDEDQASNNVSDQFSTTELPLAEFAAGIDFGEQSVTINGDLVISPSLQPASGTAGQIYYDQTTNVLAYHNGTQFIPLPGTTATTTTTNVPIQTVGTGLTLAGSQVSNSGVLSLQGQTGNVTLTAGNGIAIDGTTISSTGVVSITSGNPTLVITDDGNGNNVLTVNLGGAGVTSLNGLSGILNLANATGAGSTVTIDDASTTVKGIAQFNPTNFGVVGGVVNTTQNINTAASPTFAGVNTNTITPSGTLTVGATTQQLILQGSASTQLTATGGGFTTSLGFTGVPTGAVNYTLDRSAAPGTYALCSTVGNCAGTGTGVTSIVGGAANRLAKFTAAQNIENSTITDDGTNVTTTADLIIQGGDATIGVSNSQTGTLNFAHSGSANLGSIVQGALTGNRTYLLPDANGTFCLTSGNCSGSGSSNTLQAAYDAGNTITTTDNRNILLTFADTATDANMLINLECDTACAGNGRFAVQDDGADIVSIAPSAIVLGNATTNVPITVSSGTGAINVGNGAQARTVNVGTGAAAQTVTLGSTDTTSTTLIQGGSGNITLNSGGTIALQDSTTIAGNLTITGTATDTLTVRSPGNGSGAVVLNLQQSDNDSVLRVTDTGTLAIGNGTNVAGIFAIGNGAGGDFVEIKVDNVTANRTLQLPDVSGTLCTDAGNCGTTTGTLQNAYTFSAGGTTPEIKLDSTRNGIEIQDANSSLGSGQNFLSLRGSNAGGLGSVLVGFGIQGNLFMQPSADRNDLVDINNNANANLFTVDSVNLRVGINLGGSNLPTLPSGVGGMQLGGALRVSGIGSTSWDQFTSPDGAVVPAKINIFSQTMDPSGQIIAVGLNSGSSDTARAISLFDDRAVRHQPTLAVFSPDEASIVGFSWNGSNTAATVQTSDHPSGSTDAFILQSGNVTGGAGGAGTGEVIITSGAIQNSAGGSTGMLTLQSGNGTGTGSSSGNVVMDSGTKNGAGTTGTITIGGTNASALTLGRTGLSTNNAGTLTLGQLGTTNTAAYLCLNGSSIVAACSTTTAGAAFVQDGNTFGGVATLGTNDGFDLNIERGGTTQLTVGNGSVTLASNGDLFLQGASAYISNPQGQTASESFGLNASVTGANAVAMGNGATAAADAIAIGQGANTTASGIAIGQVATASGTFGGPIAIGDGAVAASWGVAVGAGSSTSGNWGTAIGNDARATAQTGTAIGEGSRAGQASVAIGSQANAGGNSRIVIGTNAASTADNQLVIGGPSSISAYISNAYIGSGVTDATPQSVVLQGTGGSGANVAGANFTLAGGRSTGSASGGNLNFQISAPGGAGSSLNTLTTVASLSGASGAATFQNATNSANAFRILNTAGTGEHLGVDTTDSILRLLANNTGHLNGTGPTWTPTSTLTDPRGVVGAVTVNGFVYSVGGCDGGGAQNEVYYARANSDGTLGTWAATTSLPFNMCGHAVTTYNGYIYANGSTGSATTARDVVYAKPNADGTITNWTTQNDPTNLIGLKDHGMSAYNGFLYITAGQSDDGLDTRNRNIYYGRIMADGSVPSFTVQTNWLDDQDHIPGQTVIANGFLYVMGSANFDKFYYGRINADGTVVANTLATGVTDPKKYASIAVMNGYMYVVAGGTTPTDTIQYAPLAASGDIGTFTTDTITLPATRWLCPKNAVTLNGYIYVYGCSDSGDNPTDTVYYAGGSRVKVGASLDLVGYSGENMGAGGTGGQLTAGNTFVNGSLSVTGNSNLKDGATVGNALNVLGTASVQTSTNTTTGFQVLNASAVPLLIADTTNSRIYIGNPTSDTTGALLVLDTKSGSGDPTATGLGGAMYYSSYLGTMRCYEQDQWTECLGVPRPNTNRTTHMVANGDDEVWTGYGDVLTNIAPAGSGGSLSSNLVPSVYNDTAASIGSQAGVEGGNTYYGSPGHRLVYQTHLDPSQDTVRIWAGLTTEDLATMAASATPAGSFAAFRYDVGAGDATWKCITRDGVSATTADSGIAIADDQKFEIVLDDGTRALFKINGQIVCTVNTTVPSDNVYRVVNSITALDADVKTIYVGWIYVEGDSL